MEKIEKVVISKDVSKKKYQAILGSRSSNPQCEEPTNIVAKGRDIFNNVQDCEQDNNSEDAEIQPLESFDNIIDESNYSITHDKENRLSSYEFDNKKFY